MKTALINNIVISENRQRQEFDAEALQALASSIRDRGLMHPIVLREVDGSLVLVAGERRLRAMKDLHSLGKPVRCDGVQLERGYAPYVTLGELSKLDAEEAELDENLKRRDLTWQEHAQAVQRLHDLRQAQKTAAVEKAGVDQASPAAQTQTVAETAKEVLGKAVGGYQDTIRKEIIVARHLDNPEIAKAKSAEEAFKILKKAEQREQNIAAAVEIGKTFSSASHRLLNEDCIPWMKQQAPEQFDVILTDPPYGMGADSFGDAGGLLAGSSHEYSDDKAHWLALMEEWCPLAYKLAKPKAHAYVCCDVDLFHALKGMMQKAGWYVFRTPFIIHKLNTGRVPLPDRGPRRTWEMLLYGIKGDRPVTHIYPDVIPCQLEEASTHGAQKPIALLQNLLARSCRPGDSVLDTFAGTGTIFPAAHNLKVFATGIEMSAEFYAVAANRLKRIDNGETS